MVYGETTTLTGKSGAQYQFAIFPRHTRFQNKGGVYVMGKALEGRRYAFCFVGHAGDLSVRPFNKDKTACFSRFGADHIFVIEEFDANRRAQIAEDLIQAYAPSCNAP
jgi:hypothetical protein